MVVVVVVVICNELLAQNKLYLVLVAEVSRRSASPPAQVELLKSPTDL